MTVSKQQEQRPYWVSAVLFAICAVLVVVFIALGNWQMQRLSWKLDLIEAVETRAYGEAVALPNEFDPDQHAYLRVQTSGKFVDNDHIAVKAVTELGQGYWIMMPMRVDEDILWVNRGFVSSKQRNFDTWSKASNDITGLLRPSEVNGTLLEQNNPNQNRWVARDTLAMSEKLGLDVDKTLPYFIDADHLGQAGALPRGGLTKINFRNTHLVYALTWYAMALFLSAALFYIFRFHKSLRDH